MNWQEIKEKYPNASKLYQNFGGWSHEDKIKAYLKDEVLRRDLYDFFDEQNIFINVSQEYQYTREVDEDGRNSHYVPDGWDWDIHDRAYYLATSKALSKSRKEAEQQAFLKAFEILENKLK